MAKILKPKFDPVASEFYGALREGAHLAGYSFERACTKLERRLLDHDRFPQDDLGQRAKATYLACNPDPATARRRQRRRRASRSSRSQAVVRMREIVVDRFPACFVSAGEVPRPLAIGIDKALTGCAPDLDPAEIETMLAFYTTDPLYYAASIKNANRVSLDGNFNGWISRKDAVYAARRLKAVKP